MATPFLWRKAREWVMVFSWSVSPQKGYRSFSHQGPSCCFQAYPSVLEFLLTSNKASVAFSPHWDISIWGFWALVLIFRSHGPVGAGSWWLVRGGRVQEQSVDFLQTFLLVPEDAGRCASVVTQGGTRLVWAASSLELLRAYCSEKRTYAFIGWWSLGDSGDSDMKRLE